MLLTRYAGKPFCPETKFIVYALLDPRHSGDYEYPIYSTDRVFRFDHKPFYVGKGKKKRPLAHFHEAAKGKTSNKCQTIREVWKSGESPIVKILWSKQNELDALARELVLIKSIGRSLDEGPLTNISKGGQSNLGFHHTEEFKRRRSEVMKGYSVTPGWKISKGKKGIPFTEKHKQALSAAAKARIPSETQLKALRAAKERDFGTKEERALRKKKKSDAGKKRRARKLRVINASKNCILAKCPHCDKVGQMIAMRRWHFDNCRSY
jgi:hypothetical protein